MGRRSSWVIHGSMGSTGTVSFMRLDCFLAQTSLLYQRSTSLIADLHRMKAPYQPDLIGDDDTRHFDEDIPDEVSIK